MSKTRRQTILDIVEDLVSDFVYYDRKESESLPRGALQDAVRLGEITQAEIVAHFAKHLGELT